MRYAEGVSDNFCLRNVVERASGVQEIPTCSSEAYTKEQLLEAIVSNTPESLDLRCQVEKCAAGCSILFEQEVVIETERWNTGLCGR